MLRLKCHRAKRDVLGFRLPMLTYEEPELDISEIIVIDPDNTYFMRMGSEAMTGYHILKDHVLVIDRTLKPTRGNIVVFFHNGDFYTREYYPEANRLLLRADRPEETLTIENGEHWVCWGVVTVALHPLLTARQKVGRYAHVCAC